MKRLILSSLSILVLSSLAAPVANAKTIDNPIVDSTNPQLTERFRDEFFSGWDNKSLSSQTRLTDRFRDEFYEGMDNKSITNEAKLTDRFRDEFYEGLGNQ